MPKHNQEQGPAMEAAAASSASMEQVRELLFGNQLKDMELRFQRQEELLQREVQTLRDAVQSRLDSLEHFMKSETSSLLHRLQEENHERGLLLKAEQREREEALKSEQRERAEAVTRLGQELSASAETLELKISKVASVLDTAERELRDLFMAEAGALSAKVEERHQTALNVISSAHSHLRQDAVDRAALSGMFAELAVKLSSPAAQDAASSPDAGPDGAHE